ncbi:MAG: thrombospondin type 3 repeat-containing protein [Verrucomicrobiales bacterium]
MTDEPGNTIRIVARDSGSGAAGYRLDASETLPGGWSPAVGAAVEDLGGGQISFTAPKGAGRRFFRIVGAVDTGELDPDGDGLITAFEMADDYSDPLKFDTDGDGFNDGEEYAANTNPRDKNSRPFVSTKPLVEFAEPLSAATEGDGIYNIPIKIFPALTGSINFSVNSRSTASAPGDYGAVSGSVAVSGNSGIISLVLADNLAVDPERIIILDLEKSSAGAYLRGGTASHVVCLNDNDAYYNGALIGDGGERNFRLRVLRHSGGSQIAFVSGGGNDGLSAPEGVGGSQSDGVIPAGTWIGSQVIDNAGRFRVTSPAMTFPAGEAGGLFAVSAQLQRVLALDANDPSLVLQHSISGAFTESISSTDPGKTYLNHSTSGQFTIFRDLPLPAEVESEFKP